MKESVKIDVGESLSQDIILAEGAKKTQKLLTSKQLEDVELMKYFTWVHWNEKIDPRLKLIHHIPNERKCSWAQGKILKQKGVRAGVLDVNCAIPIVPYPGLWLEFKIRGKSMSDEQVEFSKLLYSVGYLVRMAWTGEEGINLTIDYLRGRL